MPPTYESTVGLPRCSGTQQSVAVALSQHCLCRRSVRSPCAINCRCKNTGPAQKEWDLTWAVFPLKAFRGANFTTLKIQPQWDDADLLRALKKTYDELRTPLRGWCSLKSVGSVTAMVLEDHSFVYPQWVGPPRVSTHRNLRLRWFLKHPESLRGAREFMHVLTARIDLGIEFVERWQASRLAIAILFPVFLSVIAGVLYSALTKDVSSTFTIAGYMTSAYSVWLVLVGVLNLVEF
ncbi:hypothetical protein OBBRIDRAFT_881196 [Obba rivulosa]|uniref:Uncharacterized protein n=1 Tax=Obba rivulosa TaxID=1052685 RepID=A0A8E2DNE1_9APHY|nr:hypothetical protein OBBRIDRAFT_881196 [Obba rivulosa]